MKKKLFAIVLSLAMAVAMMPAFAGVAFAEGEVIPPQDSIADNEIVKRVCADVTSKLSNEKMCFSIADPQNMNENLRNEARENIFDYLANIKNADENAIENYNQHVSEDEFEIELHFTALLRDGKNGYYLRERTPHFNPLKNEYEDRRFFWVDDPSKTSYQDKISELNTVEELTGSSRDLKIAYFAEVDMRGQHAYIELPVVRNLEITLLDIKNKEDIDDFIQYTMELRSQKWEYNDLRLLNVIAHKMDENERTFKCTHPESFFGGEFKSRYEELVGKTGNLSIDAFIPLYAGKGDPLWSEDNYQSLYYLKDDKGNRNLYFIDNLNSGNVEYQFMMFVKSGNGNIIDKANQRLADYFKGTDYKATVSKYDRFILTEKGLVEKMADGHYESFNGWMPEYLEQYKGKFNSMFDSIGNIDYTTTTSHPNGSHTVESDSAKGYQLYQIKIEKNGKVITKPFVIGRINSLDKLDKAAYAEISKEIKNGNISSANLEGLNGAVPFDTYADINVTTEVSEKLEQPNTAIDVNAGSNMSVEDAKGGTGYKMQVTLSDVTIAGETLEQGDNFKVWDNENECFLKNGDGEVFAVGDNGEVVFTAMHFSTYAIVKTDEEVNPHVHVWDDGTVTKEPTSTTSGIRTYKCTTCGEIRTEDIPYTNKENSSISTGDSTNVMPYAILGGVALLALAGLVIAKKRKIN